MQRIPTSRVDPGPFPSVSWPIVRPPDETQVQVAAAAAPAAAVRFRHALLLLCLGSGFALAFEVALTRVCSAVLQYHVSFAVVSLAVLGLGLGGFLAYLVTRRQATRGAATLTVALLLVSPGILLTLVALLRLPFATHWTSLLFLMLPPFIAVGALQALLLRAFAHRAGALYAADLLGGATGAALARPGIDLLGGPVHLALLLALFAALLALWWCMSAASARGRFRLAALLLAGVALAAVLLQGRTGFLDVRYELAPRKLVAQMLQRTPLGSPRLLPELQRWDATSRVDVLELRSPRNVERLVFIDGETPTAMLAPGSPAPGAAADLDVRASLPALPHRLLHPESVLAIGSGGGYDVVVARAFGATVIDAVELNGAVLQVVERARDFTGDVYRQPGVRLHQAEGRQFAEASAPASYDLVVLVLAQSLAGNLREYALSENYLYTSEAFTAYLAALRPGGGLALLVNDDRLLRRLFTTAWDALAARGRDPGACLVAVTSRRESPYDRLLLVRERPFEAEDRARLAAEVGERGYEVLHLPPGTPLAGSVSLQRPQEPELQPATDDRPFVFDLGGGLPPALGLLLGTSALLLAIAWAALGAAARSVRPAAAWLPASCFVLLGLGFLMVEVLVLQKSLLVIGTPTLNLSLVLCTFLLGAGAGSAASARFAARQRLRWWLLALIPALCLLVRSLDLLHAQAAGWPTLSRCLGVAGVVAPCAFLMGMPFPLALRALPDRLRPWIPWFWGLNGVASILGSALIVACVLQWGFRLATALPAAAYLLALLALLRLDAPPRP